ncbi:MAG: Crp/Fnr family transcriptional regulator [Bacteroidota bacterium]
MTALIESLSLFSNIDDSILDEIVLEFDKVSLKRKECLVNAGEIAGVLAYIDSGYIRMFNIDVDGNETTVWIGSNGKFITDISSFVFKKPSFWNIEALTDCQLRIIKRDSHFQLCKKYREWLDFENFLLSKALVSLEYRMFVQMNLSAEERYKEFFKKNSLFFNDISLKHIASFLGMSAETLSRLRKNK